MNIRIVLPELPQSSLTPAGALNPRRPTPCTTVLSPIRSIFDAGLPQTVCGRAHIASAGKAGELGPPFGQRAEEKPAVQK